MAAMARMMTAEVANRIRDLFEAPEASVTSSRPARPPTRWRWPPCRALPDDLLHPGGAYPRRRVQRAGVLHRRRQADTCGRPGPDDARRAARAIEGQGNRGVHGRSAAPVAITQVTEMGNVYSLDALRALCKVAASYDLPVHLDGARFANALRGAWCTPAEMTWKAGRRRGSVRRDQERADGGRGGDLFRSGQSVGVRTAA